MPAATVTRFCSAIPTLKKRFGNAASKSADRLAYFRSAVRTTIRSSSRASSARISPAERERSASFARRFAA
jgi:hypothetical protein